MFETRGQPLSGAAVRRHIELESSMNQVQVEQKSYQMPPQDGFTLAYFLTVADIERSARFYETGFGGRSPSRGDSGGAPAYVQNASTGAQVVAALHTYLAGRFPSGGCTLQRFEPGSRCKNPVSLLEELMETKINEIANSIYRLSTFVPEIAPPAGFTFNQFLVLGDEPLLFHTGLRRMFPLVRTALSRILPPE